MVDQLLERPAELVALLDLAADTLGRRTCGTPVPLSIPLVGVSIEMERGCQHFDSVGNLKA